MSVEKREVATDDRDREGDDDDAADCAHAAHDFTQPRHGVHVPVADRGDGDEGPPERVGNRAELRCALV